MHGMENRLTSCLAFNISISLFPIIKLVSQRVSSMLTAPASGRTMDIHQSHMPTVGAVGANTRNWMRIKIDKTSLWVTDMINSWAVFLSLIAAPGFRPPLPVLRILRLFPRNETKMNGLHECFRLCLISSSWWRGRMNEKKFCCASLRVNLRKKKSIKSWTMNNGNCQFTESATEMISLGHWFNYCAAIRSKLVQ